MLLLMLLCESFVCAQDVINPVLPRAGKPPADRSFQWRPALGQYMRAMLLQHGFRLAVQPGTSRQLRGRFFPDYLDSLKATTGWGDGDNAVINYVNHPIQGAVYGYIYLNNDPKTQKAHSIEFGIPMESLRMVGGRQYPV